MSFYFSMSLAFSSLFFFNDPATTEIYTLSLHDALPISAAAEDLAPVPLLALLKHPLVGGEGDERLAWLETVRALDLDRKSTRLNSSHSSISYAVFCLKKKKKTTTKPIIAIVKNMVQ